MERTYPIPTTVIKNLLSGYITTIPRNSKVELGFNLGTFSFK